MFYLIQVLHCHFITPLVDKKFDVLPDIFIEPFLVTAPKDHSAEAKNVFRSCPISLNNRVT